VLRCATPLDCSAKAPTGEKADLWGLRLGRRCLKIRRESSFFPWKCDRIEKTWAITLPGGVRLPLCVERRRLTEYTLRPARLRRESAEQFLRQRLEERLRALIGDQGEVQHRDLSFEEKDGVLIATLTASCEEDIAVVQPRTE
jgi:similar to stage IV sporulation protein